MIVQLLIQKLAFLQDTANRKYFAEGLFESRRENDFWKYSRPDTNIFFTTLVVHILQKSRQKLPTETLPMTDLIIKKAIANYEDFRNKDGLPTYNFFKTKPSQHFPNGYFLRRFEHFRIPDDVDDTAFVYQTLDKNHEQMLWLQQKLANHANGASKHNTQTFPEYRQLKAYSTWFGKNMYVEFDICVLCNILSCLLTKQIPLDQCGKDSLFYIKSVILAGQHIDFPFRVAHQYPKSNIIIYHVVRFITDHPNTDLEILKPILAKNCIELLSKKQNYLDQILLLTSLLRLDKNHYKNFKYTINNIYAEIEESLDIQSHFGEFFYFIAGMLTAFENKVSYALAKSKIFHIYWKCDAFNYALMLEFVLLIEEFPRYLKSYKSKPN